MDFVVFGLQPWDIEIGSNCKDIALELSKKHRVLYVNAPLSRKHFLFNRSDEKVRRRIRVLRGEDKPLELVSGNLWVLNPRTVVEPINFVRPHALFALINRYNNKRFANSIKKAIEELGFEDYILFNDNSIYLGYHLHEYLDQQKYIYYVRDNLTKMAFWSYHGSRMEPALIRKADSVVTNSIYYQKYAAAYNARSFMIGQGCNFSQLDLDSDITDVPNDGKPIIGYVGFLTGLRLSIDLIDNIAHRKPEWNIVLVGPEDTAFKQSALHNRENVFFLGAKDPKELGSYIRKFDVCINPQIVNDVTIGNYPRKVDEYLYLGKPCVAIRTEAMVYFEDHVSLASSPDEYIEAIRFELENDSDRKSKSRKEFALSHNWSNSVKLLLEAL